jgi:hypothetical protein
LTGAFLVIKINHYNSGSADEIEKNRQAVRGDFVSVFVEKRQKG